MSVPLPSEQRAEAEKMARTIRLRRYLDRFAEALKMRHHELRTGQEPSNANKWAEHWFWKAVRELWDREDYYVHGWAVTLVRKLCELNANIAVFGAKQTSKSTSMAAFALVLYWAFRGKASIIYRTTTLEEAMQRGWGEIQRLHSASKKRTFIESHYMRSQPPKIIERQGSEDQKRAIIMKPAKSKGKSDSGGSEFSNIKGFHADVQLIIDDELNELPDNASSAPKALYADYKLFWYVGIGNPTAWDDVLGRLAAPTEVTTKEIEELDLDEWKIQGGVAIRYAAYRSPNIELGQNPDGTWPYMHLPTPKTYQALIDSCGSEDHPDVWQFGKALPHPQGNVFTLMSSVLVKKTDADKPATFADSRNVQIGASLDPSFTSGGDDCVLRFFQWGQLLDGGWAVEFTERVKLKLALGKEDEIYFFVAEETRKHCEGRGVSPDNFAFDCTGTGLGLKSVFSRVWPGVHHYVEFSNKPSDRRLSIDDPRKGSEVFLKRACEISFKLRLFVEYAQVRGLGGENSVIVQQGAIKRWWKKGNKREVESKDDIYKRNKSCDDWDAAAIGIDMLCQKGYIPGGQSGGSAASHERQTGQQQERQIAQAIQTHRERQANRGGFDVSTPVFNPAMLDQDDGFDEGGIDW